MNKAEKSPLVATVVGILIVAVSTTSHAFTYMSASGNSCQPQTTSDPINHTLSGTANPSSSTDAIYYCPLFIADQTTARTLNTVVLKYHDGTSTGTFDCEAYQTFPWGSVYTSSPKYTCSTAGGCTDPTTAYTGFNYVQWTCSELGTNICTENLDTNIGVYCNVPAGNGSSYVISYYSYY